MPEPSRPDSPKPAARILTGVLPTPGCGCGYRNFHSLGIHAEGCTGEHDPGACCRPNPDPWLDYWHALLERDELRAQVERYRDVIAALEDELAQKNDLTRHTRRDWRAVTAEGGSPFSEMEGAHGEHFYAARGHVQAWIDQHPNYGGGLHLECWEQSWASTEATWTQVPIDPSDPSAFPVEEP